MPSHACSVQQVRQSPPLLASFSTLFGDWDMPHLHKVFGGLRMLYITCEAHVPVNMFQPLVWTVLVSECKK